MGIRFVIVALGISALLWAFAGPVHAGVISQSKTKITQLRIVHSGLSAARIKADYNFKTGQASIGATGSPSQPTSWGVYSDYIGPGDIRKLIGIDIYLDSYNRITSIKVKRESYTGDIVTSIFTDIVEFSIQTLKPGANRPYKETPIVIRTADSITFP